MNDQKSNRFHPAVYFAMLISFFYWSYLALTSKTLIYHDSLGYRDAATIIFNGPWTNYFATGPNREPLYPLLVSFSMGIGRSIGVDYLQIQIVLQMIILAITQFLTANILKKLAVCDWLIVSVVAYLGFSPAIVNSAGILYSEILTYPFILWLVLRAARAWTDVRTATTAQIVISGLNLALAALLITFTKGIFEITIPLLLLPFLILLLKPDKELRKRVGILLLTVVAVYEIPLISYKLLNKAHNGIYALTNRGSFALYGNTARRMLPLDAERFKAALFYTAGLDVCQRFMGEQCDAWGHFTSDILGFQKLATLRDQGISAQQSDKILVQESFKEILKNPLQYSTLAALEGTKLFFWEAQEIYCIVYPEWVSAMHNQPLLRFSLRFIIAIASMIAFIFGILRILKNRPMIIGNPNDKCALGFYIILIIGLYIILYLPFLMASRYALPIAPLFLIMIALFIDDLIKKKRAI
jgi:hypothetical protein